MNYIKEIRKLSRLIKAFDNQPRFVELKRKDDLHELTLEEMKELTVLYQQRASLLYERTILYWKQTDQNFAVALIFGGIAIVLAVVALIIKIFFI